jgi:hypothetical protein
MKIGQIVLVNSVSDVNAEITKREEASFCRFLKIKTASGDIVGLTYDIVRHNPEMKSIIRPKDIKREEIVKLFPDTLERYPTIIGLFLVGYIDADGRPHQRVPPQPPDIYDDVETLSDEEVDRFHKTDGRLMFNYLISLATSDLSNKDAILDLLMEWIERKYGVSLEEGVVRGDIGDK